jgi:multidrug efflux pump subunit AcrA (membrane-fusion protein)
MPMMKSSRLRPALFVLGVMLMVGTLLGARHLAPGAGGGDAPAPESAKSKLQDTTVPSKAGSGPVVLGFVDSDPPVVKFGLPPNMQSGLVAQIFVKEGDKVLAGAKLFAFDSSLQKADVKRAEAAVLTAEAKLNSARAAANEHSKKVGLQQQAVDVYKLKIDLAANAYKVAETNLLDSYKTQGFEASTFKERLEKDPKLLELRNAWETHMKERDVEAAKLEVLKSEPVDLLAREAEAAITQAKAEVGKAQAALDLCTVVAHVPGIVERISVSPGDVMGISSQTPAMWFVPDGPRIVRAEVEPEFAHRVSLEVNGPGSTERKLTVYDNNDSRNSYAGVLKRVGTSFLPKRNANEGLMGNDTRILECVIEVKDAAPAGKPPLRVGQKVRVNFGQ